MKALATSIPVRYLAQLVDSMEARGAACRDALSDAQLRALADPQAKLTLAGLDTLIGDLARLTGRGDLGFEAGLLVRLTSHDVLGYAIISCPTLDHMLRLASRYYRLMTPMFEMRYQRSGRYAEVGFVPVMSMPQRTLNHYLELQAVSFHMQVQAVTQGRQPVFDVGMGMAAPAHARRYRELALGRWQFGENLPAGARIRLDACELDAPLPLTDPNALRLAENQCKLMMEQFDATGKWSDWVAMMLRHAEDCQPTQRELASLLNISARTLDRSLALEDTRYRDLAVRIRNERARALLAEGKHGVSQVAYRLGYTDIANFSRSFKRINGVSPSAFMEQAQD
jgi:AraC-like DNA-binding protein